MTAEIRTETGPGWTLHLGDCLDPVTGLASLADKSVDVCLTDPPYEAEAHTLQRRAHTLQRRVKRDAGTSVAVEALNFDPITAGQRTVAVEALNFDPITAGQRTDCAVEVARSARHRAVVFCQAEAIAAWRDEFNAAGMPYRRSIPWNKPDAMPSLHGRWPGQSYEAIVLAQHPSSPACPCGGGARSYRVNKSTSNGSPHPTTKPLLLMLQIVEDFTDPGDLVLDPFAGSGTTGVACLRLGRRFIGWERDPNYFEIACRRLRGDEAKPNAAQPSLFGALGWSK